MSKGLPRSLARNKGKDAVNVMRVKLNHSVTVSATSTAVGFGTVVVGDFPEGNILLLGAVANVQALSADADIGATWDGDFSIGTTGTADVTLDGTDVNIIPSTAFGAATAKLSPVARGSNATAAILNNTDGSLELNLSLLIDAANIVDDASAVFTVTGDVWVAYAKLGDD